LPVGTAIQSFVTILQKIPAAVIQPNHIGQVGPALAADMPLIAVSLDAVNESPIGIGGVVGLAFDGAQWIVSSGTRVSGLLRAEIWAANAVTMNQVINGLNTTLSAAGPDLVNAGFTSFQTQSAGGAEGIQLPDSSGALHATLDFSIVHEDIASPVIGPGGTIKEIDVTIDSQLNQVMTLK
jgi:hypothetical protein